MSEVVDEQSVKGAVKSVRDWSMSSGYYAPLMRRCPLYADDEIPNSTVKHLDEVGTCACTDGEKVYFKSDNFVKMFEKAKTKDKRDHKYDSLLENVESVVAHEYTHILMQHVKRGAQFVKKYGWDHYKTFALACDIEANRGYLVSNCTMLQIGVTDETFPEVKGVTGLMNIYRKLLETHKDDIDNEADKSSSGDKKSDGKDDKTSSKTSPEAPEGASSDKDEKSSNSLSEAQKELISGLSDDSKKLKKDIEKYLEDEEAGIGGHSDEDSEKELEALESTDPRNTLTAYYDNESKKALKVVMGQVRNILSGGNQVREKVKTYARPARRDGEDGLMRKGTKIAKVKAPRILIAMDSSGSMSNTTMQRVASSIGTIVNELGRDKRGSYICEHEAYVKNVQPLKNWQTVVAQYEAGGENDFNAVLNKALELDVEVVLNIGDGCDYVNDRYYIDLANKKNIKWYDVVISHDITAKILKERFYQDKSRVSHYFHRVPLIAA